MIGSVRWYPADLGKYMLLVLDMGMYIPNDMRAVLLRIFLFGYVIVIGGFMLIIHPYYLGLLLCHWG